MNDVEDVREYIKYLGDEDAIASFQKMVWLHCCGDGVACDA